jgi:hypothetical protein
MTEYEARLANLSEEDTLKNDSISLNCSLVPADQIVVDTTACDPSTAVVIVQTLTAGAAAVPSVWLSYADALELHGYLAEVLGLSHPAPSAPLTASVPAAHRSLAELSAAILATGDDR